MLKDEDDAYKVNHYTIKDAFSFKDHKSTKMSSQYAKEARIRVSELRRVMEAE